MAIKGNKLKNQEPIIGALLRLAHQSLMSSVVDNLDQNGYHDVFASHFAIIQELWNQPEGCRLVELAKSAKITKQSMGELVHQLREGGYLVVKHDPKDNRAKNISLSAKGKQMAKVTRNCIRQAERAWSKKVGVNKIKRLKQTLREVVGTSLEI